MQPSATQATLTSLEPVRGRGSASWLLLMAALPVLVVVHVAFAAPGYSTAVAMLAGVSATVALGTVLRASPERIPFTMAIAVVTYVHYGSQCFREGTLTGASGPIWLSDDSVTSAMAAAALGVLLVIGMSKLMQLLDRRRVMARALASLCPGDSALQPSQALLTLLVAFSILSTAVLQLRGQWVPGTLRYPILLTTSPALYQTLLFAAYQRRPSRYLRALFWGFTASVSLTGVFTGMLGEVALPWIAPLVLRFVGSKRAPWGLLAVGFVAFMILNPAKALYRQRVWQGMHGEASMNERAAAWADAVGTTWGGGGSNSELEANLEATADRVSSLQFAAHTIEWVPSLVPYAGLARWKAIPESFIPRALWPNKLSLTEEFNHRYNTTFGLQTERSTEVTTVNVTLISDAYWGAGWLGVVCAYLLVGALMGFYELSMATNRTSTLAMGLLFLINLGPSGHLAGMVTGIPQRFAATLIVLWGVAILCRLTNPSTKPE